MARTRAYHKASYHEIAHNINKLVGGPWKEYITRRSRSEPRFDIILDD